MQNEIAAVADYRLVIQLSPRRTSQSDLFYGNYACRAILTNDWESAEEDVIVFYRAGLFIPRLVENRKNNAFLRFRAVSTVLVDCEAFWNVSDFGELGYASY